MKYRTFKRLLWAGLLTPVAIGGYYFATREPAPPPALPAAAAPAPAAPEPAPAPAPTAVPMTTEEIRKVVEAFLTAHPDRQGKTSWPDCIPGMPFRATAIHFPEADHQRWSSSDPTKWSQIRLTQFSDGRPDEKWLLKEGHTYKREVLDANGKVTETQYF